MKYIAAKLVLSGLAILVAIAPVPFEKWAWQRIAFGIIGLTGMTVTKTGIDKESEEQRLADIYEHEEKQHEKELNQVQRRLAIEAAQQQEAVRFGLQTQVMNADYQGAFVTLMEEKHPYYLDALQAQQQAALEAQARSIVSIPAETGMSGAIEPAIEVGQETLELSEIPKYLRGFIATTCLVWGNQGGGKSWFVRYLAKLRVDKGYHLIIFDPNSNRTSWQGVELINKYADIEEKMRWYIGEVQKRYAEFIDSEYSEDEWRELLWQKGLAISIICEEVTTYEDFIDDKELIKAFIKVAATLSRKQEMPVTFVTHNNTQTCLGNIKGLATLIANMQQIKLIPKTDPETDQPVASGLAEIRTDGSIEWTTVKVPPIKSKIVNFGAKTIMKTVVDTPVETPERTTKDSTTSDSVTSIETQKEQLDATFNKTYNPLDHFMQEASQEQLEEMIKSWRELADASQSDVSDTAIQKNSSDTYHDPYQSPEALQGAEPPRIWDTSDFAKYLPGKDEIVMYQELDKFYREVSRTSPSRIIKEVWKLSRGEVYRLIGKPCFTYLVTKYGTEEQKTNPKFVSIINECLASDDVDDV